MNMFAWTIVILTVGLIGLLTALADERSAGVTCSGGRP